MPDSLSNSLNNQRLQSSLGSLTQAYKQGMNNWLAPARQALNVNPPGRPSQKSMFASVGGLSTGTPTGAAPTPPKLDEGIVPPFFTSNAFKE